MIKNYNVLTMMPINGINVEMHMGSSTCPHTSSIFFNFTTRNGFKYVINAVNLNVSPC